MSTMKLPALYEVAEQYLEAATALQNSDLDEQTITDTLEGLLGDVEVKATNVAAIAKNFESAAAQIREAERSLAARRQFMEKRADRIKAYLEQNMKKTGINKIESPWFNLAIKKNPAAVIIRDASVIPDEFMRFPPVPAPEPDKAAIKTALAAGKEVPGCSLEQGTRLEIK